MKKAKSKILTFPTPKQPTSQTIVCQIGRERFAIHFEIEDLPHAAPPPLLLKSPPRKGSRIK
jgi:hypothetical protein